MTILDRIARALGFPNPAPTVAAPPRLIIAADHWLICENGHRAFRAKRDVWSNEIVRSADFEPVKGPPPLPERAIACPICGGKVLKSDWAPIAVMPLAVDNVVKPYAVD